MELKLQVQQIIEGQRKDNKKLPVDLCLVNGNIILKSFHITDFDNVSGIITGLTMFEEYASLKENRSPVYCSFKIDEIKSLLELENKSYFLV